MEHMIVVRDRDQKLQGTDRGCMCNRAANTQLGSSRTRHKIPHFSPSSELACISPIPPAPSFLRDLLCLVAILLVASAVAAQAKTAKAVAAPAPAPTRSAAPVPAPAPSRRMVTFSLKCIIHNLSSRVVTLKLVIQGKPASKAVVAKAKQWCAIGPVKVGCKVPVVVLDVTVKNNKGAAVTKSFPVKLATFLKQVTANSSKHLALSVSEVKSYPGAKKVLLVKIGRKELRRIQL